MSVDLTQWRHVFKLDPAKTIDDVSLRRIAQSGTDALMIGGTTGVTKENTYALLQRIRLFNLPYVLEVSDEDAVVYGFDHYFIPFVLNTSDVKWMVGRQQQAIKQFDFPLPWEQFVSEAYVILNPSCAAAQLTGAMTDLSLADLKAYARLATHFYKFPIFYIEYSGSFGNMTWVRTVRSALSEGVRLFYGGGIDSFEKAALAAEAAETVVVGNVIYEDVERALDTVRAVKGGRS